MLLPERPLVDDADQVLLPKEAQDVLQGCTLDISPFFKEVVLLHKPSKSLLMADAIWRVESQRWRETIVAEVGWGLFGVRGRASFPYPFYLPSRKKKEVQGFVDQVLSWDFARVFTAHLDLILDTEDAKLIVEGAFDYILK